MILSEPLRSVPTPERVEFSQSKQKNGGISGMSVTIRVKPKVAGVVLLWLVAGALLALDFVDGARDEMGRAAIVVGMGAMTWTIILAMNHCRRVILEVMSYEHRMQMLDEDADGETCTVRALRR